MLTSLSSKDTHFGFHAHIPSAARLNSQRPTSVLHKQTQTGQIFSQVLAGGSRWSSLSTTWQLFSPLIPPHTSPNSAQLSTSFEPNTGTKPGHSSFCTSVGAELTLPLLLLSEVPKTTSSLAVFNIFMNPGKNSCFPGQNPLLPPLFLCSHYGLFLQFVFSGKTCVFSPKSSTKLTRPQCQILISHFLFSTLSCPCSSSAFSCQLPSSHCQNHHQDPYETVNIMRSITF